MTAWYNEIDPFKAEVLRTVKGRYLIEDNVRAFFLAGVRLGAPPANSIDNSRPGAIMASCSGGS